MEERRRFLNDQEHMLRLFEKPDPSHINENETPHRHARFESGGTTTVSRQGRPKMVSGSPDILTSVEGLYDRDPSEPGRAVHRRNRGRVREPRIHQEHQANWAARQLTKCWRPIWAKTGSRRIIADGINRTVRFRPF